MPFVAMGTIVAAATITKVISNTFPMSPRPGFPHKAIVLVIFRISVRNKTIRDEEMMTKIVTENTFREHATLQLVPSSKEVGLRRAHALLLL